VKDEKDWDSNKKRRLESREEEMRPLENTIASI